MKITYIYYYLSYSVYAFIKYFQNFKDEQNFEENYNKYKHHLRCCVLIFNDYFVYFVNNLKLTYVKYILVKYINK